MIKEPRSMKDRHNLHQLGRETVDDPVVAPKDLAKRSFSKLRDDTPGLGKGPEALNCINDALGYERAEVR